jgi:Uma2 family endonuclease
MPLHPTRTRSRRPPADVRALDEQQLADLAERLNGAPVPGLRMSERQFVAWAFEHVDAEWVDGEIILMAPESDSHNDVGLWLVALFTLYAEASGGTVRNNMFLRLPRGRRLRVPDLMYFTSASRKRIRPTYVDGPPDLVVEIVSPDSQNRDRRDKYLEYQSGGVREYWVIDPLAKTMDAYALRGRQYRAIPPVDDRLESIALSGVFLRSRWIFGGRRPKVPQVLKQWGVRI